MKPGTRDASLPVLCEFREQRRIRCYITRVRKQVKDRKNAALSFMALEKGFRSAAERDRVFHTTLGHDVVSMKDVGFVTTLDRRNARS